MTTVTTDLANLAINSIRTLSIDAIQQANSGHPGLPMGAAPMAYALWQNHLRHNPQNPDWLNRDRFVLSAGHGSMLIYSLLHLTGYDVSLDDLKAFRQWGSITPGHPEAHETPGVEVTTGPLGQGLSTAVGLALAEVYLAGTFNTDDHAIIDHYTYVIASDGDIQEGITNEASSLAAHWGLNKLIVLYDANDITLDGTADIAMSEDVGARYEALGWNVLHVEDGDNWEAVNAAIVTAKEETERPTIIVTKTTIGYGSPNKAGTSKSHGSPLGDDEIKATKENLGWPSDEPFFLPGEALEHWREAVDAGAAAEDAWNTTYEAWKAANADIAASLKDAVAGKLPDGWDADLPSWDGGKHATRGSGGDALRAIAKYIPTMIGGDADLAGSTKTLQNDEAHTGYRQPVGKNVRFGIREHAMGAIVNGLALHGGIIRPYSATFLTFADYMRGAIRLGALMNLPVAYVFTHDSIGLGEDGPTHQPVEQLTMLRATPNLYVFRPGDANESAEAWRTAMMLDGPVSLVFTRQKLAALSGDHIAEGVAHGAYTYADADGTPDVILMATGSEVEIAHAAWQQLMDEGVKARLVSMPCQELFDEQDDTYKESVLPSEVRARVSIEAGSTLGWYKYVGMDGEAIGVDTFGASAPYEKIYEAFGLTADAVVEAAKRVIAGQD
ncbi:MAG: transketolase [Chloroflexota bacterium]